MKLFNPFKPHIVQFGDGTYGVRRLSTIFLFEAWEFLDSAGQPWFCEHADSWGRGSLEWAENRLEAWKERERSKAAKRNANKHKAIK